VFEHGPSPPPATAPPPPPSASITPSALPTTHCLPVAEATGTIPWVTGGAAMCPTAPPPSLTPTTPPISLADRPRSRWCPYHLIASSIRNCPSTSFYHQGWSLPQPQQPPPLTQHCYHRSPPSLGNTVLRCPSLCRRPPAGPARQGHQDLSIIRHGQTRCRWA
jgi:hypothetical protein